MSDSKKRWRGLAMLVRDAVEHGSRAIEKVHLETARRPFAVLEHVPGIEAPSRVVHAVHDLAVSSVYTSIRVVNKAVGAGVDLVLDATDREDPAGPK